MKYINTVVPVAIEHIKEYFKDKNLMFLIDYTQSKLQDKVFLTYLSNLDVPCDLDPQVPLSKEQKFSLLKAYLEIKNICDIPTLNMAMAELLLMLTGIDPSFLLNRRFLTDDEAKEFMDLNSKEVIKWVVFVDSTMVFLLKTFQDLDEVLNVETTYQTIDDPHFVGLNVVNLLGIPGFLELYFSKDREYCMKYLKQQFENHMFKGKSLYNYYVNDVNMFVPLLSSLIANKLPTDPNEVLKVK